MISKYLLAIAISFTTFNVFAQDVDPQKIIQQYDQNHNQTLDEKEFEHLQDFAPYSYANIFQGKNSHHKIFKKIDQNHDGQLSYRELQQVNQIIENQYIGWVWTLNSNQVL